MEINKLKGITERKLEHMRYGCFRGSLNHFLETGTINGSFLEAMNSLITECEGETVRTSEKDLRVCEVIASAFFKVTFSYKQGNPRGGIPYWKEEVKVYEASNENELNTKINVFLSDDNCGYQKHKKIVDVCKL